MSRSSPRRANVAMPYSATSAAATSSLVESGFDAASDDLRAAGLERAHQVGRLGRDVEAGADAQAVERPLALEALADEAQDGHLALRPFDATDALGGEAEVGDVVGGLGDGVGHRGRVSLRAKRRRNGAVMSGQGEPSRWMRRSSKRACSAIAEPSIGVDGGRIVRPDVEDDLVARPQQVGGDGAGHGRREAATAIVDVGQDVADDGQPGASADDVGPGRGDELAVDAHPVVDAIGDGARRQPRGEAQLVQAVELADLDRQQPLHGGRVRPEARAVDPHPDHLRPGVDPVVRLDRGQHVRARGDVGGPRPDDVAQDGLDRRRSGPSRTAAAASVPCTRGRPR